MILLIDNYDSFTYNLYQYLCELTEEEVRVVRNDAVTLEDVRTSNPRAIVISPGPGRPEDAGISIGIIKEFTGKIPILGVCLGHQAIGFAFGGSIIQAKRIVHGKVDTVTLDGKGLFRRIPDSASFTRYHSLAVDPARVPAELEVTAWSSDGEIMGLRHREYVLEGVQFHPESIASEYGKLILANFLDYRREPYPFSANLNAVMAGKNLGMEEAEGFMEELTAGNLTDVQIAGFLTALNAKGIRPEEIAGCAAVLQRKRITLKKRGPVLDTCGTGGDGLGTFNISSFGALIASSCGVPVAKHGNRAVSSVSGSADFYRELGIPVDLTPLQSERLLEECGFTFLFAPIYHGAMKYAAVARRQLGVKTLMNLLGPLANPAGAEYQLIGVFSEKYLKTMARAALLLGIERVMVVHGSDGLDEITTAGPTRAVFAEAGGKITEELINPESLGFRLRNTSELKGGTAAENAAAAEELLAGRGAPALRDAVVLNAGAALYVAGKAANIAEGCAAAAEALSSGRTAEKVRRVRETASRLRSGE